MAETKLFVREDIDSATHFKKALRRMHGGYFRQLAAYTQDDTVSTVAYGQTDGKTAVIAVAGEHLYVITKLGFMSWSVAELYIPKLATASWLSGHVLGSAHLVGSGFDLWIEKIDDVRAIRTAVNAVLDGTV